MEKAKVCTTQLIIIYDLNIPSMGNLWALNILFTPNEGQTIVSPS